MTQQYPCARPYEVAFPILGARLNPVCVDEVHGYISDVIERDERALILNLNVHCVNLCQKYRWLKDFVNQAQMVFCDGDGVRLAAKLLGLHAPPKITYDRWIWQLTEFAVQKEYRIFFLGGEPGVADEAAEKIKIRFPKLNIVGTHHGYFQKDGAENEQVIAKINQSKPDILVVGFGMPVQEKWLRDNWHDVEAHIFLTGGAVFDYVSGRAKRAVVDDPLQSGMAPPIHAGAAAAVDALCLGKSLFHVQNSSVQAGSQTKREMIPRPGAHTSCTADARSDNGRRVFAVVVHAFEGGGSRRDVILLCNALVEKGEPVTILTLQGDGPLRSLIDPRVNVVIISGGRIRRALPGLRRAIRAIAPRLVLCSESSLNLCCLAAVRTLPKLHRPSIVLREVASPSAAQQHDPSWQSRLSYRILHRLYRFADRVITLTDGARDDLLENFAVPADKVVVMRSNAVITPEIAQRIARWDGEEGREPDLIVSVGRLSPEKDHLLLLRALALVGRRRPWRLVLVGDGSQRPALEEFVRTNGLSKQITFAGYMADPFVWLMRAKVAVCSSVYEGLCNAIIEALGCGTPVVSTDCPYGPREILQHGRFGTLVPMGDAPALASAIDAALDCAVDRTTLIGRAHDYTSARAADNFLEITSDL